MLKRKGIAIILFAVIIVLGSLILKFQEISIKADDKNSIQDYKIKKKRISNMTDNELTIFLSGYTSLYNSLDEQKKQLMFRYFKSRIDQFDSYGKTDVPYSYTLYISFAKEIDEAVKLYYGEEYTLLNTYSPDYIYRNLPEYNELVDASSVLINYNCYAYAVDKTFYIEPGFSFNNNSLNLQNETALSLATYVKTDLQSSYINKNCVKITTICPTDSIFTEGKNAICVRMGIDENNDPQYHFMKLQSDGWYHKPGLGGILRYLQPLSSSANWNGEYYSIIHEMWMVDSVVYSGTIYYIIYKSDHAYQWIYTGNNYHSGHYHYYQKRKICPDCGTIDETIYEKVPCSGPPCPNVIGKGFINYE